MNNQIGNRDKKVALLLIAAFAWLFIGSLIIFHEEHVLGKHFAMNTKCFISPKSNEKKDLTLSLQKSLLKFHEDVQTAGILSNENHSEILRASFEFISNKSLSFLPDDVLITQSSLRAPPYSC